MTKQELEKLVGAARIRIDVELTEIDDSGNFAILDAFSKAQRVGQVRGNLEGVYIIGKAGNDTAVYKPVRKKGYVRIEEIGRM
jgi:hypothetical protein